MLCFLERSIHITYFEHRIYVQFENKASYIYRTNVQTFFLSFLFFFPLFFSFVTPRKIQGN